MGSPFKGMEERFNENMTRLYGRYSLKDGGAEFPLQEIKPDDPTREEKTHDTYMLPVGSTKEDVKRMAKLMKTPTGLVFLLKQEIAQAGNQFSQTRIINPFFVIENAVPFIHTERSFGKPTSFEVGHLQQHTADAAIARVMGTQNGITSILGLFSSTSLGQLAQGFLNVFKVGVAMERPELNVGGNLYAVQLWKGGYQLQTSLSTNLDDAKNALKSGNIKGAVTSVQNAVKTIRGIGDTAFGGTLDDRLALLGGRVTTSPEMDGRRYFITGRDTADTYLVGDSTFLHYNPPVLPADATGMPTPTFTAAATATKSNSFSASSYLSSRDLSNIASNALTGVGNVPFLGNAFTDSGLAALVNGAVGTFLAQTPSTDSHLRFPALAMKNRYASDARIEFLRTALANQQASTKEYWKTHVSTTGIVTNGHNPGDPVVNDPKVRIPKRRYIHDKMNDVAIFSNTDVRGVTKDTLKKIDGYGKDLIRVHFFDVGNGKVVPFRAFITDINESVTPEFSDTRYVGRIERNVVYVGVNRELNFTLMVQAFSDSEMDAVWKKINYVTGLCYPAGYDHGFMIPPFVKLTIGNFYHDQPGYIRSLTHHIDPESSWETTEKYQVPFGITMNITFSVIEKKRVSTGSTFYPFGV